MSQWLTDDQQWAWRGLVHMTSRLDARLNRELQRASGLSLADYDVLVLLSEAPDGRLRVFELAEDLQWEQSRLSHHLARMQRRGLVAREECTTDRRGAFVVWTDAGRDAIEKAAPAHVATVRQLVFGGLAQEQVAMLESTVNQVLSRLAEPESELRAQRPDDARAGAGTVEAADRLRRDLTPR
jgi:DNA-binding MarR family transcriptional regulator